MPTQRSRLVGVTCHPRLHPARPESTTDIEIIPLAADQLAKPSDLLPEGSCRVLDENVTTAFIHY